MFETPMISRRRLLGSAAALGAGSLGLSGCAGTLTRPAPGNVVTFINTNATWTPGFDAVSTVLDRLVGYVLQSRPVSDTSQFQQMVRMSARTDTSADLIKWWTGYRLVDVARDGMLADVTSVWDEAEKRGWINDPQLKETFSYQGRQYGMPLYKTYYVFFYSKKAFRDADVEVPTSWDELMEVCEALKAAGITPIASSGATSWESCIWFGQLVAGTDHDFYDQLCRGEASYLDQPALDAMELWSELYQRGFFSAPDIESEAMPGLFNSGEVGMHLYGTWNTGSFVGAGLTDDDFGAFLVPPVPGGEPEVIVESSPLSISAGAHKSEAAMEIERAWLHPEVQKEWVGFLQDLSANPAVLPPAAAARDVAAEVERIEPRQSIRYWEASPPVLVEGNVEDLSAFMTDPTPANARATLTKLQKRSEVEWEAWRLG